MTEAAISCFFEKGPEIQPAVQPSYKGAFGEEEQTQSNNRLAQIDNRSALQYWQDELVNKAEGTRVNYLRYFKDFLKFVNMTADEVFTSRKTSALNKSRN